VMIAEVLAPFIFQQGRSVNGRIYRFLVHAVSAKVTEGSIAPIAREKAHATLEEDFSVPTLTKAEIVENLFAKNLFTKGEASHIIETLFELMRQSLEQGEDVLISGFGKFSVKGKSRRRGRNPQSGEPIMLPPRRVVTFKCSGVLREAMNREQAKKPVSGKARRWIA
jgi:integration host factor subunit alpha